MKLAVIAVGDPLRMGTWSGTPYFMTRALQKRYPDLVPVRTPRPEWLQFLRRGVRKVTGGRIDMFWNPTIARLNADHIAWQLKAQRVDVAFCIGNAPLSAFLANQISTVHVSDATAPLMLNYNDSFARLPKSLSDRAVMLDKTSVQRAAACLYPTEWAAQSAIKDFGASPSRVHVNPWGANIPNEVSLVDFVRSDVCHLVFIGTDWELKGGAIALDAAKRLAASGHKVILHVLGAKPNLSPEYDSIVKLYGFINKGTAAGRLEFDRIMRQASFLFVPTRQEAFGIMFSEANAYGIPAITTRTGGVPNVVCEGVNGRLLPMEATGADYADLIWSTWSNRSGYDQLRKQARNQFDQVLNWDSWLKAVTPLIEQLSPKDH